MIREYMDLIMEEYFKKIRNFSIIFLSLPMMLVGCSSKEKSIKEAFAVKENEEAEHMAKVKKDKTKPVITGELKSLNFSVDRKIDYDQLASDLKASDNVDGDLSSDIKLESTDVVDHQEGEYTIVYSVCDTAKNKTRKSFKITVTSKYSAEEKNRLLSAYNATRIVKDNKQLTNLYFSDIISSEDGATIIIGYSGDESDGSFSNGRIAYFASDGHLEELNNGMGYPASFVSPVHEYDEDDIKCFVKYYHLEN